LAMIVSEPETLRTRFAETFGQLLEKDSRGRNAEKSVYNYAVRTAESRNIVKRWNNEPFVQLYLGRARAIYSNLRRDDYLKNEIDAKRIKASDLGSLSHPEMAPKKWKKVIEEKIARDQLNQEVLMEATATEEYLCRRCNKRKCTYYELQTRSADEPMTTFVHCLNCGNHWRF